jgi:hypothetical protein
MEWNSLPSPPNNRPNVVDDTCRSDTARWLVNDNSIPVDDRVAAALVVLYG